MEGAFPGRKENSLALETRNLSVHFGGLSALDSVDLAVVRGEIFGLLGPNGAGKTTMLNLIGGAERPSSGTVLFNGCDISAWRPDRRARAGIARTFQITRPFEDLTVEENVMVGFQPRVARIAAMREASRDIVDLVGLSHKRRDPAKSLSTGQRKRLELARALATGPSLLLMDEVTGGVDQASIPGLTQLVARLKETGITIVLIEHNMKVMTELCDRMMFLNRGRTVAVGAPADVMRRPEVVDLYLGQAAVHA